MLPSISRIALLTMDSPEEDSDQDWSQAWDKDLLTESEVSRNDPTVVDQHISGPSQQNGNENLKLQQHCGNMNKQTLSSGYFIDVIVARQNRIFKKTYYNIIYK